MRPTTAAREAVNRHQRALLDRGPMTREETAEFRRQLAQVIAQDERRRAPAPQLELPEAA